MLVTFLKLNDTIYIREGNSSGPPDGQVLYDEGGFRDVSRYILDHRPACDGDWFVKDANYLPGKPTEPGAYWLRFSFRWVLCKVFRAERTLMYRMVGSTHPAAVWPCRNMDGFVRLPDAPEDA